MTDERKPTRVSTEQTSPVPDGSAHSRRPDSEVVPVWLAAMVLVLLLAVVGVAGFVVRGMLQPQKPRTVEELAVERALADVAARPKDAQARLDLAFAYQQAGSYKDAITEYDTVLTTDPKNPAALYNKGMVYFELQDPKRAEELLRGVLEVNRTHVLAAKALGDYYASKNQYRSLLETVRPAAQAHPEMADLQYLVGLADERLGRKKEAIASYRAALKYVPDMKEAREGLQRLGIKP